MVFLRNHHLFLLSDNISTICLHIFIFLKFFWNSSFMAKVYTNIVGSQSSGESFSSGLVYSLVWGQGWLPSTQGIPKAPTIIPVF